MRLLTVLISLAFAHSSFAYAAKANQTSATKKTIYIDESAQSIPSNKENRIVRYTYSPDVIFRIFTLTNLHTHIELGEDEGLVEKPIAGDTAQWRISGGPRNLYVKPVRDDIETSMTVVTNKRVYQFQLIAKQKTNVFQKVSFDYPDREAEIKMVQEIQSSKVQVEQSRLDSQILVSNADPASLDFSFKIMGEAPFKPTSVYTDGKFTFLRMPNTQDMPVVLLIDDLGKISQISYKVKENLIIVERVAKHLLLKLGDAEVQVHQVETKTKASFWN